MTAGLLEGRSEKLGLRATPPGCPIRYTARCESHWSAVQRHFSFRPGHGSH
jgi:hypothetical protein